MVVGLMMRRAVLVAAFAATLIVGGCGAKYYEQSADEQVYAIIQAKQKKSLGRTRPLQIESEPERAEGAKPNGAENPEGQPPGAPEERGEEPETKVLNLADCLQIATRLNRSYQSQKETVYLAALALTAARYDFDPQWSSEIGSDWDRSRENVQDVDSSADLGISYKLRQGAEITANIAMTALRYINANLAHQIEATFDLTVSQPLWRGSDPRVVQENLIQAERNAVYAVRTFARYEKTFAVGIADDYFRVLEQQDEVENRRQHYESLKASRERAEWLARAGRLKQFQVDQTRQDELEAENRWITSQEQYATLLDEFKITLGLPTDAAIELDRDDLDRLAKAGLEPPDINLRESVAQGLETRLDLQNSKGAVDDARRKVYVAKDDLKGDITLVASWGMDTPTVSRARRLRWRDGTAAVGFDFDLPLDRLDERNAYRTTQISLNRAIRGMTLKEDNVKLEVRTAHQGLNRALKSYEIQRMSVALAERRVESTELLLEAGRAITRDVLEARRALVDAKNSLTQSLVDYTIARLRFQRDVGTLTVDEKGWINDPILQPND